MKNRRRSRSFLGSLISRRKFLGQTTAAAIGFSIVPRRVLGGVGYILPSDKVNIAFIGVGSQGLRVMLRFLREPDVQGVAVCDPNRARTTRSGISTSFATPSANCLELIAGGTGSVRTSRSN
jgi:hypothetical protein